jgi:hypothetical protein
MDDLRQKSGVGEFADDDLFYGPVHADGVPGVVTAAVIGVASPHRYVVRSSELWVTLSGVASFPDRDAAQHHALPVFPAGYRKINCECMFRELHRLVFARLSEGLHICAVLVVGPKCSV